MERRKLTKEDIDKVRDIEGFPIGTDESIIALSDAPYYTACPNPFIEDFIREHGTPYDEETDDYHREPFASDVSEGKTGNKFYNAHSYHTKVPHKAIMRYLLHYTNPGDIVLDGFCGSGMTGVAAQMCGTPESDFKASVELSSNVKWGARKAILTDLSPMATFLTTAYTSPCNLNDFIEVATGIIDECEKECAWMEETNHIQDHQSSFLGEKKGKINYTVWSDVIICPHCGREIVYWNVAKKRRESNDVDRCYLCGAEIGSQLERVMESYYDEKLQGVYNIAKEVPVLINYSYGRKKYEKEPDEEDIRIIKKINQTQIPYWYPIDKLPEGYNTEQPRKSHNLQYVHQFYTKRNLYILSKWMDKCLNYPDTVVKQKLMMVFTGVAMGESKLNRFLFKETSFPFYLLSGTLYVGGLRQENNPLRDLRNKALLRIAKIQNSDWVNNVCIGTSSSTELIMQNNCIDYIFVDPPFGGNLNYSELSFMWESWLRIKTNNQEEAIMNPVQKKGLLEYQTLMMRCFAEFYRVLKPGRWMTVEFHNSKNSVWNAIQEALQRTGFIVADVRTLDKKQQSFKQVNFNNAVKQDLVISAYKPTELFSRSFLSLSGDEESVWAFVRQHLSQLPVVVDADNNGKIDILLERQATLLFDRMVAYHIMQGIAVPIDATEFYTGLNEHFIERDNMYFLSSQINEYDLARAKADVEEMQLAYLITDEKTAIQWLYNELKEAQTYQVIMPKFMQAMQALDKHEKMPELAEILEENFLKDDGKWYIPDLTKSGDIAKLREKNLLKEFQEYLESKGKLKVFRSEAVRAGFAKLWKDKDYKSIVSVAERLPEKIIQEDPNLLMYYDISLSRVE